MKKRLLGPESSKAKDDLGEPAKKKSKKSHIKRGNKTKPTWNTSKKPGRKEKGSKTRCTTPKSGEMSLVPSGCVSEALGQGVISLWPYKL